MMTNEDRMKIKIETNGHQMHSSVEGEVLSWCMTAQRFGGQWLQVPCVILKVKDSDEIQCLPLSTEYTYSRLRAIE